MRPFRILLTIVGVTVATTVMAPAPASASVTGHYTGDGIRIRSCPRSSCSSYGLGYPSQNATIYCYKNGDYLAGSDIWYYHRNQSSGVTGYSASTYMDFNGSVSRC